MLSFRAELEVWRNTPPLGRAVGAEVVVVEDGLAGAVVLILLLLEGLSLGGVRDADDG